MVADGWRVYAAGCERRIIKRKLRRPVKHIAYLLPVYQVLAMEDRNAGKIAKTTVHQVKIIIYAAHAWVRVKTGNNGICIGCLG